VSLTNFCHRAPWYSKGDEVDCLHSDQKHYHAIVANVKESRSNNCNEFQFFWVGFVPNKHNPLWVSKHVLALHREGFSLSGAEQKYNAAFFKKTYHEQQPEFQTNPVRRPRDAAVELSETDEKEGPMPHMYRHHHHLKMTMVHLQMMIAAAMVRTILDSGAEELSESEKEGGNATHALASSSSKNDDGSSSDDDGGVAAAAKVRRF
jgi:hypothetical protein